MRPTISLALIVKNEERNLTRLLKSVEGCFDEIVVVDTGSTDNTKKLALLDGCRVHDFEWCDDFSKARNEAFSKITSDFGMWLDADDILDNKESFIQWRDYALEFSDYWLVPYHYTLDQNGKPVCTFVRERVIRMSLKPQWNYFVHEGIHLQPGWRHDGVHTWSVKHMRTVEDMKGDRGRNLRLLENKRGKPILSPGLDTRMQWYLGKEYYDNQKHDQALTILMDVIIRPDLEIHDRILAMQFASYSAMALSQQLKPEFQAEKLMVARQLAQQGLNLDPKRAEFYCLIGETYLVQNDPMSALPYYSAAEHCITPEKLGTKSLSPIFTFANCYEDLPKIQKAKIYMALRQIEAAEKEALECVQKYGTEEAKQILSEIQKVKPIIKFDGPKIKTDDIVFSCPPHAAYPFDEEMYKHKGLGGSETALVEMSMRVKRLTGKRVIVFNVRDHDLTCASGVEWISNSKLNEYMSKYEPQVHIAWRHNIKVTNALTYLWAHDLLTPTVEMACNFDFMLCLSEFHKQYTKARSGVPENQIIVTRNGINPDKFAFQFPHKNPNKLVFMSSPDRGLDFAMLVCDRVRQVHPVTLDSYYGFDNMYKFGMTAQADHLKAMASQRPWVNLRGFTEQNKMYREVADASVWIHPANFIETSCITALEMLALHIFPVTRKLGALTNTLGEAENQGHAVLLAHQHFDDTSLDRYAQEVIQAIDEQKWERLSDIDIDKMSWEGVCQEWIQFMNLGDKIARAAV